VTIVVLIILAVMWAAVLLPPWLRNRSEQRPADSIVSFRRQLSVLERAKPGMTHPTPSYSGGATAPSAALMARRLSRAEARRRRRDVLVTLLGAAGLTLVLGVFLGPAVLLLHVLIDILLAGYVALLVRAQRLAAEREMKVRFLPNAGAAPEPVLLLRRSAN
jgi:hypothetical protein